MPIAVARLAAFDVLLRVRVADAYAAELLHAEKLTKLVERDRNLATQIAMGTLRWQSRLDETLAQFLSGKNQIAKLDAEVLIALRMAAFQLLFLDRIPPNAAVNDSVELVKRAGKRSAAPFVNAVLRKVAAVPKEINQQLHAADAIANSLAHPRWLVERWIKQFGIDAATRICETDQHIPVTALRLPVDESLAAAIEAELRAAGIGLDPGKLMRSARRIVSGNLTSTAALRENRVAIQDEASQLVAALVGRGNRILDCCAAPGGKTSAISARNPGSEIIATEIHAHRARTMRELVTAKNVEVAAADITSWPASGPFDRVLADVPCSGTGTLGRNPEIKWRLKPEDLAALHKRQVKILNAALDRAQEDARIVYSTCSLEREEDEDVVAEVLNVRKDVRIVPIKSVLSELRAELAWKDLDSLASGDFLRTLPGVHPCDGFFAAILKKGQ